MNKVKINRLRHLLKAISYRVYSSVITAGISSFFIQDTVAIASIGAIDFSVKIFTYYVHERIWYRIPFGVKREP